MAAAAGKSFFPFSPMDITTQWVFTQKVPADIVVKVGDVEFPLHKFLLVEKSGYIRRKVGGGASKIDASEVPGGAEAFEKAAMFCYGVNFEISVHNVASLRCAAEFLEMNEEGNLASRMEEFLSQASAMKTLAGASTVLASCEQLLPMADALGIVRRCIDFISWKVYNEANFPTRSPPHWWATELGELCPSFFEKVFSAMKARGSTPKTLSIAFSCYAEERLPDLLPVKFGTRHPKSYSRLEIPKKTTIESLVSLLPPESDGPLHVGFLCNLLKASIFLNASDETRRELERRVSGKLDQASVGDLLTVALDYKGNRIADLDSVRRILESFVEKVFGGIGFSNSRSSQENEKVVRTVDAFAAEIATDEGLSVTKFAGIAAALPKAIRRLDDDIYRAVDIFLKAHPQLDEIEREKVCSVMDPMRLSYDARLHASQNKRLPLQIVLHVLYFDQLKIRSSRGGGGSELGLPPSSPPPSYKASELSRDLKLVRENEALRAELARMKTMMHNVGQGSSGGVQQSKSSGMKKGSTSFFASVSRTLGKLNPFRNGSKDTFNIIEGDTAVPVKPRRRRFSIS